MEDHLKDIIEKLDVLVNNRATELIQIERMEKRIEKLEATVGKWASGAAIMFALGYLCNWLLSHADAALKFLNLKSS